MSGNAKIDIPELVQFQEEINDDINRYLSQSASKSTIKNLLRMINYYNNIKKIISSNNKDDTSQDHILSSDDIFTPNYSSYSSDDDAKSSDDDDAKSSDDESKSKSKYIRESDSKSRTVSEEDVYNDKSSLGLGFGLGPVSSSERKKLFGIIHEGGSDNDNTFISDEEELLRNLAEMREEEISSRRKISPTDSSVDNYYDDFEYDYSGYGTLDNYDRFDFNDFNSDSDYVTGPATKDASLFERIKNESLIEDKSEDTGSNVFFNRIHKRAYNNDPIISDIEF